MVLAVRAPLLLLLRLVGAAALVCLCSVLHLDRVLLLDALVAVRFTAGGRVRRAGHAVGLRLVIAVGGEAVVGGAGAGTRAALVAELDKAVDEAVLRGEVREVVVDGQAVRVQGRRDIGVGRRGAGRVRVRDCSGCLLVVMCVTVTPEHKLAFLRWKGRVLGRKGGVHGADRQVQVARVAEVKILRLML